MGEPRKPCDGPPLRGTHEARCGYAELLAEYEAPRSTIEIWLPVKDGQALPEARPGDVVRYYLPESPAGIT